MKHIALIPAKKNSTRCPNKNWRDFINGYCLVDFVLKTMPTGLFNAVIVSTDNENYKVPEGIKRHLRHKSLSGRDSHIEDLIQLIIREYRMTDEDYIWLLNPTSPFRLASDYRRIMKIIKEESPISLISVAQISPFIWKDNNPLFEIKGKRRNTDDFKEKYAVENGMFYVVRAGYLRKNKTWYAKRTILYKQDTLWSLEDIDTEDDFAQAKKMGEVFLLSNKAENASYHKRKIGKGG